MRSAKTTVFTLLRHPLALAVLLYAPLLHFGGGRQARLFPLEPIALVASDAAETPDHELSDEERLTRRLHELESRLARQALVIDHLSAGARQLADLKTSWPNLADNAIAARVILRGDSSTWRHTLYLNRGSSSGVAPGYAVVHGGTLLGRVLAAGPHVCAVQLLTDPDFVAPVSLVPEWPPDTERPLHAAPSSGASRGLLRGNATATPRLPSLAVKDVALEAAVEAGMMVVTNEGGGTFPPGLYVGRVSKVRHDGAFLAVDVEVAVDAAMIDAALILPWRRPELDELGKVLAGRGGLSGR